MFYNQLNDIIIKEDSWIETLPLQISAHSFHIRKMSIMEVNKYNEPIYIVCVLYNELISGIRSLDTFLSVVNDFEYVKLIVLDNSKDEIVQENIKLWETTYSKTILYASNNGNVGLSKAYNNALKMIKDDSYWIMISDDDTLFSKEYIYNVIKATEINKTDIISGIVLSSKKTISPAKKLGIPVKYIHEPGIYTNIFCINSGLTIKSNIFDKIGLYDEHLFLDGIDHLFSDKLIANGLNNIEIVPGNISQCFSAEVNDYYSKKARIKIYSKDWFNWWKASHKHTFFIFASIIIENISVVKRFFMKILGLRK